MVIPSSNFQRILIIYLKIALLISVALSGRTNAFALRQIEAQDVCIASVQNFQKNHIDPVYPIESLEFREEGALEVGILVNKTGDVTKISVKKSTGFPRLDKAAVEIIRGQKFLPAILDGQTIDCSYDWLLKFNLSEFEKRKKRLELQYLREAELRRLLGTKPSDKSENSKTELQHSLPKDSSSHTEKTSSEIKSKLSSKPEIDIELRETVLSTRASVTDLRGAVEIGEIPMTVFRPPREGKFPLVILNHGRPLGDERRRLDRQRLHSVARYFVAQGFVVIVPTRIGYGEFSSGFDPEYVGCSAVQLDRKDESLYRQIMAVLSRAKSLDYVDSSKWLVVGHSVGGFAAVSIAYRAPQGLVGAINFSGGYGGDPDRRKNTPCDPKAWERFLVSRKPAGKVPVLWVYWENDLFWGQEIPRRWYASFRGGGGEGSFKQLSSAKGDGHSGLFRDFRNWIQVVEPFLVSLNLPLDMKGTISPPPPSGFASIADVEKVPYISETSRKLYPLFFSLGYPRALAVNSEGSWSVHAGHWDTPEQALLNCNKRSKVACQLYAVDDDVVWEGK